MGRNLLSFTDTEYDLGHGVIRLLFPNGDARRRLRCRRCRHAAGHRLLPVAPCNDALDSEPKNANCLDSRGWVYLRLGKFRQALTDFDGSIEYRPNGARSLFGRGLAKTRLGDTAKGEADLEAVRMLLPDIDLRVARAGLTTEPSPRP